jgi:hypothetical protein
LREPFTNEPGATVRLSAVVLETARCLQNAVGSRAQDPALRGVLLREIHLAVPYAQLDIRPPLPERHWELTLAELPGFFAQYDREVTVERLRLAQLAPEQVRRLQIKLVLL